MIMKGNDNDITSVPLFLKYFANEVGLLHKYDSPKIDDFSIESPPHDPFRVVPYLYALSQYYLLSDISKSENNLKEYILGTIRKYLIQSLDSLPNRIDERSMDPIKYASENMKNKIIYVIDESINEKMWSIPYMIYSLYRDSETWDVTYFILIYRRINQSTYISLIKDSIWRADYGNALSLFLLGDVLRYNSKENLSLIQQYVENAINNCLSDTSFVFIDGEGEKWAVNPKSSMKLRIVPDEIAYFHNLREEEKDGKG